MNTTLFSNSLSTMTSIDQLSTKSDVVSNTVEIQGRKRSALIQALALRCNETDESSDETESNHSTTTTASDEEDEEDGKSDEEFQDSYQHNRVRLPSTFGRNQINSSNRQRHFSNMAEKPQLTKRSSSSARKDRLYSKHRPAPMELTSSTHASITPSIEIEQVFDDEDGKRTGTINKQTDARIAARTKMMQAIGKNRLASLRRSESLDVLTGQPDEKHLTPTAAIENTPSPSTSINLATTPLPRTPGTAAPRTPGTAYHHRSFSCPTPKSPMLHQFGELQVLVTPPTPRPQGSPIIGVFIKGVHDRKQSSTFSSNPSYTSGRQHFCAFDDQCSRLGKCRKEMKLAVPEFELAPGRAKLLEQQRIQAMAIMAWKQQEDLLLDWGTMMKGNGRKNRTVGECLANQFSPVLLPGTPCAPSLTHVQEVRAMQSRHMVRREVVGDVGSNEKLLPSPPNTAMTISTTNATDGGDGQRSAKSSPSSASLSSSSSSSWWREPRSAPLSWNGSSASAYSQASAMSNNMSQTSPAETQSSNSSSSAFAMVSNIRKDKADSSTNWRSKDGKDQTNTIKSVDSLPSNNGLSRSKHPYVPPAKRTSSYNARYGDNNEVKGRKEGTMATSKPNAGTLTNKHREIVQRRNEEVQQTPIRSAPVVRTLVVPSDINETNNQLLRQHTAKSMLSRLSNRMATPISPQA